MYTSNLKWNHDSWRERMPRKLRYLALRPSNTRRGRSGVALLNRNRLTTGESSTNWCQSSAIDERSSQPLSAWSRSNFAVSTCCSSSHRHSTLAAMSALEASHIVSLSG